MTKLKNSNCDKTKTFKLWQNYKTQIMTKLQNWTCDKTQNWNCGKNPTQYVTKLKNPNDLSFVQNKN